MRVVFIVNGYPTRNHCYHNIFHQTQAEALQACGVDIEIVSPEPWMPACVTRRSPMRHGLLDAPLQQTLNGITIHRPRFFTWPRAAHWGWMHHFFARAIKRCLRVRPDIIHAHFAYPCGLAAAGVAREWGIPSVLTLHGSDVNRYPFVNTFSRTRFIRAIQQTDHVFAVSEALAERTEQLAGCRPTVLPIGINLEGYSHVCDKAPAREQLGLPADRTIILFVGNILEAKGIRELLAALAQFPSDKVLGVFVGEGAYRRHIPPTEYALFVGAQPNSKIPLYMAAADMLVLPSYAEGLPTVLVEAGAARLPIIASNVGGIPELLGDDRGMLIPPRQGDSIVAAIRQLMSNPLSANASTARLAPFVNQHYDIMKNAKQLAEFYHTLTRG